MATEVTKDEAIARVVAPATRMGVELNEDEAAEWVAAMETEASGGELVVNVESVNDYFERALRSVPEIEAYLEDIAKREP